MLSHRNAEQKFTDRLAHEFAEDGFELVEPAQFRDELPPGYRPDLLMRRGEEFVVIELKSREEHRDLEQIRLLKEAIESRPNWQFKLYVVPQERGAGEPQDNLEDIAKFVSRAKQLNRSSEFEAASVILWIALEVALRTLLTGRQSRPNLGVGGMSMARSLLGLGELDEVEVELIEQAWRARNLSAHGFRLMPHEPLSGELINLAEQLAKRAKVEVVEGT